MPLTRGDALNEYLSEAAGYLLWQQRAGPLEEQCALLTAPLPALQLIADNANAVPITATLAERYGDAYALLEAWQSGIRHLRQSLHRADPQPSRGNGQPERGRGDWGQFRPDRRFLCLGALQ